MFVNQDPDLQDDDDFRHAYDEIHNRGNWLPNRSSVLRWVMNQLAAEEGSRLLDVACGDGQLAEIVQEGLKGARLSPGAESWRQMKMTATHRH